MIALPRTLRARMVALFGLLIVAIAGFMAVFLPGRIEDQLRRATERRAITIAHVIASAVAPAIEFDDPDHAGATLVWLDALGDARFAVVGNGATRVAAWHGERAPAELPAVVDQLGVRYLGDQLVVSAPIVERTGGRGAIHLGFSTEQLGAEREQARRTVEIASLAVLGVGALACFVLASILVRPIRRLTETARRITRGEAPPALAAGDGADELSEMARALSVMLDRLNQVNVQLVDASRHAGMAEVATGVLHNVGNVLTSVNLAVGLLGERLDRGPIDRLARTAALLEDARASGDPVRLDAAIKLTGAVSARLASDRAAAEDELATLRRHIEHVAKIVLTQNRYAKTGSVTEVVSVGALLDEAIELGCPEAERKGIAIVREVTGDATVALDRHRVLQVLVNLVTNARDAVLAGHRERTVALRAEVIAGELRIEVADTGVGFELGDGARIFQAGFTTKPHGHGYGLHSSAIAAQQLGGTLRCASAGKDQGAKFSLRIPIIGKDIAHA
ncbi:MAG TPA: HAMP domain-containing sensor histidine kinase [Kofleriaceae bacterium]|nr:HAMP domain-containing sensor histidine kinase [Kofleriaceae bacterium]